MIREEYAGIVGRIKLFWRFRCVKLRIFIEIVGLITIFAFGINTTLATIWQWYIPSHEILYCWNNYNEAFIEYIWASLALPCVLYFSKMSFWRLMERWYQ